MTGSGSVCVAYFKDYKAARKAEINLKNKFPNYWCKLSKAM
jgi:4-diphosphocytidyl-2C-methyl-D-erythritol kinase